MDHLIMIYHFYDELIVYTLGDELPNWPLTFLSNLRCKKRFELVKEYRKKNFLNYLIMLDYIENYNVSNKES